MAKRQFSLRAVFLVTAIIAVALALATQRSIVVAALPAIPFVVAGASVGALGGRIIGTDWIDATIGAILGGIAAAPIPYMLPHVE